MPGSQQNKNSQYKEKRKYSIHSSSESKSLYHGLKILNNTSPEVHQKANELLEVEKQRQALERKRVEQQALERKQAKEEQQNKRKALFFSSVNHCNATTNSSELPTSTKDVKKNNVQMGAFKKYSIYSRADSSSLYHNIKNLKESLLLLEQKGEEQQLNIKPLLLSDASYFKDKINKIKSPSSTKKTKKYSAKTQLLPQHKESLFYPSHESQPEIEINSLPEDKIFAGWEQDRKETRQSEQITAQEELEWLEFMKINSIENLEVPTTAQFSSENQETATQCLNTNIFYQK